MTAMSTSTDEIVDYLVLGAGPAGLQMGHFLGRGNHSYRILERGDAPGAFYSTFPRHRRLISINKVHTGCDDVEKNLRWDWNSLLSDDEQLRFSRYSAAYYPDAGDLRRYLVDFAARFGLAVDYDVDVARVSRTEEGFAVTGRTGRQYRGRRLIVATGLSKPYLPDIPGIGLCERYETVSTDPRDFVGQRVLIIGKGNSGFETANNLIATAAQIHLASPRPVTMAWSSHFVGHLRAVNNELIDTYQLKLGNAILDAHIERIDRVGDTFAVTFHYSHADGEREVLRYDRIIVCTGFRFDPEPFDPTCRPELVICDRFPKMNSTWESSSVQDLYFAGTLMQMRDFKKTQSGFIHGFRYNIEALIRLLEAKYHGVPLRYRTVPTDAASLVDVVLGRINRTSALWQQPGFLGDAIVVDRPGAAVRYYEGMPVDYVREGGLGAGSECYVVTLEYGEHDSADSTEVLGAQRIARTDVARAAQSRFLHPVVRRYSPRTLLSTHHVIEDLAAEWREAEHRLPLGRYFEGELRSQR